MEFLNISLSFLFSLIDAAIFISVFSAFRNKKEGYWMDVIIILGISLVMFLLTQLGITPYAKIIIVSAILFLLTFLYDLGLYQRILVVTLYYLIIIISELLVTFLTSNILGISLETLGTDNYSYFFLGTISKFIAIIIIWWIKRLFMGNKTILPQKLNYIIISILFISTISMILLFYSSINLDYKNIQLNLFLITIFTLFSNLGVLLLYFYTNTFYTELQKETTKRVYDKSYKKYILNAELRDEKISKIWHDIGNHIRVIEKSINLEGISQQEYLNSLKQKFISVPNPINSGNRIIDIILNDKFSEAVNRGIDFDIRAIAPPKLNIVDADLSSVLFNTIDNAIQASINSSDNERYIYLELYPEGNFLCYKIKNSFAPKYNASSSSPYGRKKYISRGYGLSIVHDAVNKYKGYIDIKRDEKEYSVTIVLPLNSI